MLDLITYVSGGIALAISLFVATLFGYAGVFIWCRLIGGLLFLPQGGGSRD